MNGELLAGLLAETRLDDALQAASAWTHSEPERVLAWQYLGNVQLWLGNPVAAEASFRRALEGAPELGRNQANLALALLAQERYLEAWPFYEARYAVGLSAPDKVRFPFAAERQWRGGSLRGKRLLLVREQGLGDEIQFIRLAQTLRSQGMADLSLLTVPALAGLMRSAPGIDRVLTTLPQERDYDLWTPLLSLPLQLQLAAPAPAAQQPYLRAPAGRAHHWQSQLTAWSGTRRRMGIVWAGNPGNAVDRRRSLPLDHVFALLAERGDAMPLSLQLGAAGSERLEEQVRRGLVPLLDLLTDFSETAAVIESLDLVITVDTAVAHLAGALGKPVWIVLPVGADWRWGQHAARTPWYPSARLFRQRRAGSWHEVVDELSTALNQWATGGA